MQLFRMNIHILQWVLNVRMVITIVGRKATYISGEQLGSCTLDLEGLPGRGDAGTDRSIQAVHVDYMIDCKVLSQCIVTGLSSRFNAEIAVALDVVVDTVGDDGMVPCIVDHPRLISVVVHQCVSYLIHA